MICKEKEEHSMRGSNPSELEQSSSSRSKHVLTSISQVTLRLKSTAAQEFVTAGNQQGSL